MKYTEYLQYLLYKKKLSARSVKAYEQDINYFEHYFMQRNKDVESVDAVDFDLFIRDLQQQHRKSSTCNRMISSIKNYYHFLNRQRIVDENPVEGYIAFPVEKPPINIISEEDLEQLIEAPNDSSLGLRDRALLELICKTDFSITQLLDLQMTDINTDMQYLRIYKKNGYQIFSLSDSMKKALEMYIKKGRPALVHEGQQVVFLNYQGAPLSRQGFWRSLTKYVKMIKLDQKVTRNTLRSSYLFHEQAQALILDYSKRRKYE